MKTISKKLGAIVLALAMCFSLTCVAFAADGVYTITVENSIGDQTYSAYKVFDATINDAGDVSYTLDANSAWKSVIFVNEENTSPFNLTLSADKSCYVVTLKEEQTEETVAAWFNGLDAYPVQAAATGSGNGSSLELNVTSSGAGYYVIDGGYTTDGATVSLTTAAPDATVIDKNQGPGEGGSIPNDPWEGGFTKDSEEGTSANIGETIDYVIRSYVPTYDGDKMITDYTFTDTMSAGLTLIEHDEDGVVDEGVTVKIISSSGDEDSWVDITEACTITVKIEYEADGITIKDTVLVVEYTIKDVESEITVNGVAFVYPADAVVEISYQDVVNEAADETDLTNSVAMAWHKVDPDDPTAEPVPGDGKSTDETLYTYGFVLNKVDSENTALTGAVFTLVDSTGETITFDATDGGYEVYENETAASDATSNIEAGSVYIWGLNEGTYTLTEITAPDGYNLLTAPVTIVIAPVYDTDPVTQEPTEEQIGWSVSYTYNDTTSTAYGTFGDASDGHGVAAMPTVAIENNAGSELPSTGGMGTTIFYIIGGVLVAGAVVVLITRRRMSSAD